MMSTRSLRAAALALSLLGSSCTMPIGLIYTDVVEPLDVNLGDTSLDTRKGHQIGRGDLKRFRYYYMEVGWGANGIGTIASSLGWTRIHYADKHTVTVLWYWWQEYVDLYGE